MQNLRPYGSLGGYMYYFIMSMCTYVAILGKQAMFCGEVCGKVVKDGFHYCEEHEQKISWEAMVNSFHRQHPEYQTPQYQRPQYQGHAYTTGS